MPGVLRDINKIVSDCNANIRAQILATDPDIGYLIMDLDNLVSEDVRREVAALETNIRTRILFQECWFRAGPRGLARKTNSRASES